MSSFAELKAHIITADTNCSCLEVLKLYNSIIQLLHANVVFYHIEPFSANKILNNVKINEIY